MPDAWHGPPAAARQWAAAATVPVTAVGIAVAAAVLG
jgi:hypothetical protein